VRDNDIWTTSPDGSNQVDITNTPTGLEDTPAWSADGTQIAYARGDTRGTSGHPIAGIWVMNADGSGQRQVVAPPTDPDACGSGSSLLETYLGGPAWSPDGSKLAYHEFRSCRFDGDTESYDFDLYTVEPDGTGRALVTRGGAGPRWSPDGSKIGYTGVCGGGGCTNIWWITPDGSQAFPVYYTAVDAETFIDWSPDGSLMDGCGELATGFHCYTIHLDGTGLSELPRDVVPGSWSPDGTKFLLSGVYTENLDGSGRTQIASGGAADWQPVTGPQRSDYRNAAHFCKAERSSLGQAAFTGKYHSFGKCVSRK
jgi:Tol biopolymer transport system component